MVEDRQRHLVNGEAVKLLMFVLPTTVAAFKVAKPLVLKVERVVAPVTSKVPDAVTLVMLVLPETVKLPPMDAGPVVLSAPVTATFPRLTFPEAWNSRDRIVVFAVVISIMELPTLYSKFPDVGLVYTSSFIHEC